MLLEKLIVKKFGEIDILKEELILRGEDNREEIIGKIKNIIEDIDIIVNSYIEERNKGFTKEELATYDGKGNNLAYIAIDGTVYDVTGISGFSEGEYCNIKAGKDVTKEYYSCDNKDKSRLKSGRIVGYLLE